MEVVALKCKDRDVMESVWQDFEDLGLLVEPPFSDPHFKGKTGAPVIMLVHLPNNAAEGTPEHEIFHQKIMEIATAWGCTIPGSTI